MYGSSGCLQASPAQQRGIVRLLSSSVGVPISLSSASAAASLRLGTSVALHLGWRTRNDLLEAKLAPRFERGGHVVAGVGYAKRTYFSPTIGYFLVSCFVRVNPWVESKKYPCVVQKWVRFAYLKSVPNLGGNQ